MRDPQPDLPPFEPAPQTLTLLAELPEAELAGRTLDEETLNTPVPGLRQEDLPAPPTPWCGELGQFETAEAAAALVPALETLGLVAMAASGEVPVSYTYWVHLPPFGSEAAAQARLDELQDAGIDSFIIRGGSLSGGISLGVFSRRASAEVARAQFAERGIEADIGEVSRDERRYWLALRAPNADLLEAPAWEAFRAEHNSLILTENACEAVASAPQFP